MKNQEQYDKALKLLEELEDLLGDTLQVGGYDGYDARDELLRKLSTKEENDERYAKARQERAEYLAGLGDTPYGNISRWTALWAEQQMLKHAEPLLVLSRFGKVA